MYDNAQSVVVKFRSLVWQMKQHQVFTEQGLHLDVVGILNQPVVKAGKSLAEM